MATVKETVGGILHELADAVGMGHLHARIDNALPGDVVTDDKKAKADEARRVELQTELDKLTPAPQTPADTTPVQTPPEGGTPNA